MKKLIAALSIATLAACTKDGGQPVPGGTLDDFNAFLTQPCNGSFSITSITTEANQDSIRTVEVGGGFNNGNAPMIAGGPVTVDTLTLPTDFMPRTGVYYDAVLINAPSLFGKKVPFDINHTIISLDVPPSIYLRSPALNDTIRSGNNGTSPTVIRWTADSADTKNIIIGCGYYPSDNPSYASTAPSVITHTTATPDNGSYTLRPLDLAGFPEGSLISINITRLAYTTGFSKDGLKKYVVYSHDEVTQQYIFE